MVTINSNGTGGGNWSATTSWTGGVVPVIGDKVNILSGDTITVDTTGLGGGDDTSTAINVSGILKFSRTANSLLTVRGELNIDTGGEFDMGKSADIIPLTYTATLNLNDSAALADGKWGMTVAADAAGFYIYGGTKTTNTHLTADAAAAQADIVVNDITGWAIGDEVVVMQTDATVANTEKLVIQNIVSNTVTFTTNLANAHATLGRVGNMSKNCLIQAFNSSFAGYINLKHAALTTDNTREIQHVHIKNLGDNSNTIKYGGIRFDGANGDSDPYISLGNIFTEETEQYGLDFFAVRNRLTLDDCAHYQSTNAQQGAVTRQGSVVTFNRYVCYRALYGMQTAWSHGGIACIFNDSWFSGATGDILISVGQSFTFNDCYFIANEPLTTHGSAIFNRCFTGFNSGTFNAQVPYLAHMQDSASGDFLYNDCTFHTTNDSVINLNLVNSAFKMRMANRDVDPSKQEVHTLTGILKRDDVTFRTAAPAVRIQPSSATEAFTFDLNVFAPNNKPVTVSGYIRKDSAYGSSNLPNVKLSGLGITEDTFTVADVNDTWQQFKVQGTQTTGTDGMLTLTFTVQAAAGNVYIDDVVAPVAEATSVGEFGYWADAQPVSAVLANFVAAQDVWNTQKSELTLSGSVGQHVRRIPSQFR